MRGVGRCKANIPKAVLSFVTLTVDTNHIDDKSFKLKMIIAKTHLPLASPMWMPVHLSDHYYEKNKQYCGLYVVSKVELPDFSPTAELIRIFNRRGILIVSASIRQSNMITSDFFIVDLTGKADLKKRIRKEIMDCLGDRMLLFECIETGVAGFIYNVKGFPLIFNFSDRYTPTAALGADS